MKSKKLVTRTFLIVALQMVTPAMPDASAQNCTGCFGIATYTCLPYGPYLAPCNGTYVFATAIPIGSYGVCGLTYDRGLTCCTTITTICGYRLTYVCNGAIIESEYLEERSSNIIYGNQCGPFALLDIPTAKRIRPANSIVSL